MHIERLIAMEYPCWVLAMAALSWLMLMINLVTVGLLMFLNICLACVDVEAST